MVSRIDQTIVASVSFITFTIDDQHHYEDIQRDHSHG